MAYSSDLTDEQWALLHPVVNAPGRVIAGVGAVAAMGFASAQWGGLGHLRWSDPLLFAAVVAAAIGYAEGGLLARELGAWQTLSWGLVLCSPLMVCLTVLSAWTQPPTGTPAQWAALAYLGVVSMFLGFFAWYHGLAIGPMARVSQVQLVQPVLSICWAGLLLGEQLTWTAIVGGLLVILFAGTAVRVRLPTITCGRGAVTPDMTGWREVGYRLTRQ